MSWVSADYVHFFIAGVFCFRWRDRVHFLF